LELLADRSPCAPEFKLLSNLLLYSSKATTARASLIPQPDVLEVRAPCTVFRMEFLVPIFTTGAGSKVLLQPRDYMKMALHIQCIKYFNSVFSESFFQADSLRYLLRLSTWDMDPTFDPELATSSSWSVYSSLKCLKSQDGTFDGILPANGITMIDAKMLGIFVYQLFRVIDMRFASDRTTFDLSDLAQPLTPWRELVDHHMIFKLWSSAPFELTYWWLPPLREILQPYQSLAIANRSNPASGILQAKSSTRTREISPANNQPTILASPETGRYTTL
jgi:hypothetical protein